MLLVTAHTLFALLLSTILAHGYVVDEDCEVRAQTENGWVCGLKQQAEGTSYASFYNIPYGKPPLGELRFKDLQPVEPWEGLYDATKEGPICPQYDVLYGPLMTNKNMSEDCIYLNIYVPLHALSQNIALNAALKILVFIHGGGFVSGSGQPDLYGPEYLIQEDIIIITFNERLNFLGYLSLANSTSIPGNNGLKDTVTLLKWVKRNAQYFGGDPNDVTLGGQSSGAANAHLLCLSDAARGLFNRAILMSGVGIRGFFTASPKQAKEIADSYIQNLNITETDPEAIHQILTKLPIEKLINASAKVQMQAAVTFSPVVETSSNSKIVIINKDPDEMLNEGKGNDIPLLIGFTNLEGDFFIPNYRKINILAYIKQHPLLVPSPDLVYKLPNGRALEIANEIEERYFNEMPTVNKYAKIYSDESFFYPAAKLAELRASNNSAPVYLYKFSYNPDFSAVKVTKDIQYNGAAHIEDLTFIFKTNSLNRIKGFSPRTCRDTLMRRKMTSIVKNFMTCNAPVCNGNEITKNIVWPQENEKCPLQYEEIVEPYDIQNKGFTDEEKDTVQYFDKFFDETKVFSNV